MRVFEKLLPRYALALSSCGALLCLSASASAADAGSGFDEVEQHHPLGYQRYRTPIRSGPDYWHTFGSLSFGDGLRFNNPYRLSTELGGSAESLSLTASYFDVALGAVRGALDGIGHGAVLHLSIAAEGVPQEVLSLSYIALDRLGSSRVMLHARAGVPVILQPDLSGGLEAAFGGAFMITSGIGAQAELIWDLYYGAATLDHSVSTIPVLSAQLGVFFDYEVLE